MYTLQPISSNSKGVMVIISKITKKKNNIRTPTHGPLDKINFKNNNKKKQHLYPYSWSSRQNLGLETQHKGTLLEECIQKYMSCKRVQRRLILITKSLDDLGTPIITIQAQCNEKYYLPLKRNNNRNKNCNCNFFKIKKKEKQEMHVS
jgi:hypothetical protein